VVHLWPVWVIVVDLAAIIASSKISGHPRLVFEEVDCSSLKLRNSETYEIDKVQDHVVNMPLGVERLFNSLLTLDLVVQIAVNEVVGQFRKQFLHNLPNKNYADYFEIFLLQGGSR
jgi:hypothetical protein